MYHPAAVEKSRAIWVYLNFPSRSTVFACLRFLWPETWAIGTSARRIEEKPNETHNARLLNRAWPNSFAPKILRSLHWESFCFQVINSNKLWTTFGRQQIVINCGNNRLRWSYNLQSFWKPRIITFATKLLKMPAQAVPWRRKRRNDKHARQTMTSIHKILAFLRMFIQ